MSARDRLLIGAALLLFVALGIYGCGLGFGTDRDSIRVIATAQGILAGQYQRSRSFGFPLHEAAAAGLYAQGGLWAVNFGALLAALAGIGMAARLAGPRAAAVVVALCACPVVLVNASVAVDFAWDFAAGMAVLLAAQAGRAGWFGAAVLLALLLRPDNLVFVAAVCLAVLWRDFARGVLLMAAACVASGVAAGIYLGLNGLGMLSNGVSTTRPWLARLARAAALGSAGFGPGGVVLAAVLPWRRMGAAPLPVLVAMLALVLYAARFVVLPDQLEYLILPVSVTVLAGLMIIPARFVWPAVVLVALPSLVSVSLFARGPDGALALRPALQAGALAQDDAARRFATALASQAARQAVAAALPPAVADGLHPATYMPGYVSARGDLIIGQDHLYAILPRTVGLPQVPTVPRGYFRDIWACDTALGPGIGWRGWEAPTPDTQLWRAGGQKSLRCWRAD